MKHFAYLLIFLPMVFNSCENDLAKVKSLTAGEKFPTEVVKDAVVLYSDSAILRVRLTAPKMEHYHEEEEPYVELTEGINLVFYNELGEVTSHLTADYAINYVQFGRLEAKGNVVLINEIGEKLNTEHLIWKQREERIYSEEFVKITTAEEIIWGNGFESNQSFTNFKIKDIRGTIMVEE